MIDKNKQSGIYCDKCDEEFEIGQIVYDTGCFTLCESCKDKYLEELEEEWERVI